MNTLPVPSNMASSGHSHVAGSSEGSACRIVEFCARRRGETIRVHSSGDQDLSGHQQGGCVVNARSDHTTGCSKVARRLRQHYCAVADAQQEKREYNSALHDGLPRLHSTPMETALL